MYGLVGTLKFLGRRVVSAIPLILGSSLIVFLLISLAPGDVAATVVGPDATPAQLVAVRKQLHLDEPLLLRYWDWLHNAATGNLGQSIITRQNVTESILNALPVTLSLVLLALVIAIVVAVPAGVFAALRPHGILDRLLSVGASLGVAVPSFWLGLILISFLAIKHPILPATGYIPITGSPADWIKHLILPAAALAALPAAELARQLRASVAEVLDTDYVLAARAKGIAENRLLIKHSMKNAAIPPMTVLGFRIAQMIGGAVVIEQLFLLPGLGSLTVQAVFSRDFTTVLGIVAFTAVVVALVNVVVDASYSYFNPKVRLS